MGSSLTLIPSVYVRYARHVTRVADLKEDALEALYEKRLKKKKALQKDEEEEEEQPGIRVGHVDTLPVKTLDGQLYYRTCICTFLLIET